MKTRIKTNNTEQRITQYNSRKIINKNNHYIIQYIVSLTGIETSKVYIKHQLLGTGGFANCYITQLQGSHQLMATKIIDKSNLKSSRSKLRLVNQIKIHKTFTHPNIVQFLHHFQDYDNVYIMLQLCENQSLNQLLKQRKTLTYPQIQSLVYGICNGIKYLHDKKFIHRDLKLANIFLNHNFQVKIGDFGLTSQLEFLKENKRTVCGTPNYIAPQVLQGIGYYFQVDIWGIGIIIYTLFYGFPPFQSDNTPQIYGKIKKCQYSFPKNKNVPIEAINLIRSILIPQPEKRPTINQILNSPLMQLGVGIPLQLPDICYQRPPTKSEIQKMPLLITKPTVFKQIKQKNNCLELQPQQKYIKSDNKSTIDKTVQRDYNYMFTSSDFQQKYIPLPNPNIHLKNTKMQELCLQQNINNFQTKNNKKQIPEYIIQFQHIDANAFYFCTNNYVLEITFRHINNFYNNNNEINQIKLYNNLFSQQCRVYMADFKYKALLTLKAKQIIKNKIQQNLINKKQLSMNKSNIIRIPHIIVYISRIIQHKDMNMLKLSNKCIQIIYEHQKNGFFYIITTAQLYFYQNLHQPNMKPLVLTNIVEIVDNYQKNSQKMKKTPNIQTCVQIADSSQYIKLPITNLIHIYGIIKQLQNKKNKHSRNRNSQ